MTNKHLLRLIRYVVSARTEIASRDTYRHTLCRSVAWSEPMAPGLPHAPSEVAGGDATSGTETTPGEPPAMKQESPTRKRITSELTNTRP